MNSEGLNDIMNEQETHTLMAGTSWPNKYPLFCRCKREVGVTSQFIDPKHRSYEWMVLCGVCCENPAATELCKIQEKLIRELKSCIKTLEENKLPQLALSEGKAFQSIKWSFNPAMFVEYSVLYRVLSGQTW